MRNAAYYRRFFEIDCDSLRTHRRMPTFMLLDTNPESYDSYWRDLVRIVWSEWRQQGDAL